MSKISILHLSDIHFKKREKEGFRSFQADVVQKMIAAIGDHVQKHGTPDFVAITGDIAFDGKDYTKAREFFNQLKEKLEGSVFLPVPGNHDVDRSRIDPLFSLHDTIIAKGNVDEFLEDKKRIKTYIIPKFRKFKVFAEWLSPGLFDANDKYEEKKEKKKDRYFWVKNLEDKNISFLGLNSAWACQSDQDQTNIALGYPQVMEALKRAKGIPNLILLMHHPVTDWLNVDDFSACRKELFKHCGLVLHGHTHTDDAYFHQDPANACICLGTNATYTHEKKCRLGFQFIRATFTDHSTQLRVWPYIYDERILDFQPDYGRWGEAQGGKEFFEISVFQDRSGGQEEEKKQEEARRKLEKYHRIFADYKEYALNEHRHLPLKGFETNLRALIEIEQVYVTMRANVQYIDFEYTIEGKRKVKEWSKKEQLPDLDIKGSFAAAKRQKIKDLVILGDPGSGKTTLLKYILVTLIQARGEEKLGLDTHIIPFFAPLRELRDPAAENFVDFMCRVCCTGTYEVTKKDFKTLLNQKGGIILLDGIDEVADEKTRIKTCKWIDEARREFIHTPFVVTSRFAGYLGESRLEGGVLELSILDFTPEEVKSFLLRWFETVEVALHPEDTNEARWRERGREEALKLVKNIEESEHIRKLATNPLMLQIIALIRLDRGTKLPERRVELYNECVNVLLEKWDIAKGLPIMIGARESRRLLQPLALWLHEQEGRRSASLEEIIAQMKAPLESLGKSGLDTKKLLLNIRDRGGIFLGYSESEYGFVHLGFQEYLAAGEIRNSRNIALLIANYGNRWWREVTLLALALDDPSIIVPFMEEIVKTDAFKSDITLVCDAVNDSLIKPHEPFIAALKDEDLSLEARQNSILVLSGMGGEKVISALKEAVSYDDRALAGAAYRGLESLGRAEGIEPPYLEELPMTIIHEIDGSEMVLIPEGSFIYGSREDDKEAANWEKPQQTIHLPSFYMDIYPVTNRQYCQFLNHKKPGKKELDQWIDLSDKIKKEGKDYRVEPGYEDYPVIYVTWHGAQAYAKWSGKRLPFEVEWEKAARGTDGRIYPWGNKFDKGLCNSSEGGRGQTTPVTAYPGGKSLFGCFDMAGNVWEWCADWWEENNDKTGPGRSLQGPKSGSARVSRGGSWGLSARLCRAASRFCGHPAYRLDYLGFRLARNCPQNKVGN